MCHFKFVSLLREVYVISRSALFLEVHDLAAIYFYSFCNSFENLANFFVSPPPPHNSNKKIKVKRRGERKTKPSSQKDCILK